MTKRNSITIALALLLLGAAGQAPAQSTVTGALQGIVADSTAAALPGVTVTISSDALVARTKTTVTDTRGVYRFPSLPVGIYAVSAELRGFRPVKKDGARVSLGAVARRQPDALARIRDRGGDRHRRGAGRQRRRQRRLLEPDVGVPGAPAALARREQPRQPGPRRELRPRLRQHRGADARLQPGRRERLEPGLGGALGPHESRLDQGDPGRGPRGARRVRRIHRSRVQPGHEVGEQQRPGRLRRLLHGRRPRLDERPGERGGNRSPPLHDGFGLRPQPQPRRPRDQGPPLVLRLRAVRERRHDPLLPGLLARSRSGRTSTTRSTATWESSRTRRRRGPSSSGWRSSTTVSSTTGARGAPPLDRSAYPGVAELGIQRHGGEPPELDELPQRQAHRLLRPRRPSPELRSGQARAQRRLDRLRVGQRGLHPEAEGRSGRPSTRAGRSSPTASSAAATRTPSSSARTTSGAPTTSSSRATAASATTTAPRAVRAQPPTSGRPPTSRTRPAPPIPPTGETRSSSTRSSAASTSTPRIR